MVIKHITSGKLREYDYTRFQVHDKVDLRYEDTILEVFPSKRPPSPPPNLSTFFYYVYPSVGMMKLVLVGFEVNDLNQRGKKRLYMMSLATLHVPQSQNSIYW